MPLGASWETGKDSVKVARGSDYAEILLDGVYSHFEMRATLTFSSDCLNAGFVFRTGNREGFAGYEVAVDMAHQQMLLRRHLDRRRAIVAQDIMIAPDTQVELRVFVDGTIVEAFLDNRFSLAGRAHVTSTADRIGFYSDCGEFEASGIEGYDLKDIRAKTAAEAPVNLVPPPDAATASLGKSILFPRMTASVYTPYGPQLNPTDGLTLECWLKPTKGAGRARRDVIIKGDGPETKWHYGLSLLRDDSIEFFFCTPSREIIRCVSPPTAVSEGVWCHVAAVLDSAGHEARLYKNGKLIKKESNVPGALDTENRGALRLAFASGTPEYNPYLGLIDEVRIWTLPRSDADVVQDMSGRLQNVSEPGLAVYWKFEEGKTGTAEQKYASYCPNAVTAHPDFKAWLYDGACLFAENAPLKGGG